MNDKFTKKEMAAMFEEMANWLADKQVCDEKDSNCGAIYFPTENRYCNRDTACMARAFMRMYNNTGHNSWYKKAALAREHVLKVQKSSGGYPELRGLEESDQGSTVNTAIIAENLIMAYELGLDFAERDLVALAEMADFELTLEWKPGAFYHDTNHMRAFGSRWGDEGSHNDCQNTTALAAMMLRRIYFFLEHQNFTVRNEWLTASDRAIAHLLEGQDEDGQWPYLVGIQKKDAGHHAMCVLYLARAAGLAGISKRPDIVKALNRACRWLIDEALLQTKLGTKINWARSEGACLYFTNDYFITAAALANAALIDENNGREYLKESIELMRYVKTDLWNNCNYEKEGPAKLTEAGIKIGYAWFGQSMGWSVYHLDELLEQLERQDMSENIEKEGGYIIKSRIMQLSNFAKKTIKTKEAVQ